MLLPTIHFVLCHKVRANPKSMPISTAQGIQDLVLNYQHDTLLCWQTSWLQRRAEENGRQKGRKSLFDKTLELLPSQGNSSYPE